MPKVSIVQEGKTQGVWLQSKGFTVAAVAQDEHPPYLCLYVPKEAQKTLNGLPTVALTLDPETGEPMLQLANTKEVRHFKLGTLLEQIGVPYVTVAASHALSPAVSPPSCQSACPCGDPKRDVVVAVDVDVTVPDGSPAPEVNVAVKPTTEQS